MTMKANTLLAVVLLGSSNGFFAPGAPRRTAEAHLRTALMVAAPQTFQFPDGSSYRGGVEDGMQHGEGEWRSVQGDVYVGAFRRGVYEGYGGHADDRGNVYEGEFRAGVFSGVGTYTHADGRAECNRYRDGREVGEGVRWSGNRARAWKLRDGLLQEEVDVSAAASIASTLGLGVPHEGAVFALSPDGEARLRRRLALLAKGGGDSSEEVGLCFEAHAAVGECDGVLSAGGALIAHSTRPLVSPEECERIISECEARADALGGWSTTRHPDENYPTTDQPVRQLTNTAAWLRDSLLPDAAWPFLAHAFDFALRGAERDGEADSSEGSRGRDQSPEQLEWFEDSAKPVGDVDVETLEARAALRVSDAFVVKYNASSGQRLLAPHRDGALFSFNVALNDLDEYEGGGTYFRKLKHNATGGGDGGALRSPKGHIVAHSSALMHGGHPTTRGVRYVLVAFCTIAPEYADWASRFYEHVIERVDPEEEEAFAPRALPRGMLTAGPVYRKARQASLEGDRV